MFITLVVKDDVAVVKIRDLLTRQGAGEVSIVKLNEILDEGKTVDPRHVVILISETQDTTVTGGRVEQIRQRLGEEQRLVLCMPRSTNPQRLLKLGANEIISPAGLAIERIVERILGHLILNKCIEPYNYGEMRGATQQMRDLYKTIKEYARLKKSVLILGETGTGKGLIAEILHERGPGNGRMSYINCTAMNPQLIEDELFGHLKGAYTGATSQRTGMIEAAHHGTAFIDEVGDLNSELQMKLLDVVEKHRVRPSGANEFKDVDVRFIFATHRDLEERIEEGLFREDLFARINVLVLKLPPLRERMADIPLLVEHFVERFNEDNKMSLTVEAGAVDELFRYDWPRNVRELYSVVDKAAAKAVASGIITNVMFQESMPRPRELQLRQMKAAQTKTVLEFTPQSIAWPQLKEKCEAAYFKALIEVAKNEKQALEMCKMGRSQFYEILGKHGLKFRPDSSSADLS
jgi:DNA-binding NtrC family response regulator